MENENPAIQPSAHQLESTKIKTKMSREKIISVADEIVEVFYLHIKYDPQGGSFISDQDTLHRLKIKQVVFALSFLQKSFEAIEPQIVNSSQVHIRIGIDMRLFVRFFLLWSELMLNWIEKWLDPTSHELLLWRIKIQKVFCCSIFNYFTREEQNQHPELFSTVNRLLLDKQPVSQPQEVLENTIVPEASEKTSIKPQPAASAPQTETKIDLSLIDNMHYADHHKITAEEYLDDIEIDLESMHELVELEGDIQDVLYTQEVLNEALIKHSYILFYQYAIVLNSLMEFKDLGYALRSLGDILKELDLSTQDDKRKTQTYTFIRTIIEDIINWRTVVFETRKAKDIHFLDASIFSSIAQLEMIIIGNTSSESDDDDDFGLELF